MGAEKRAVAASLTLLGALLIVSPAFAGNPLAECRGWNAASLSRYARAADLRFNRDRQGRPILYGLTLATWFIEHERWGDAAYRLIGFDRPFWLIPGHGGEQVPAVVGKISAVLHRCGTSLGPDYSMRPLPSQNRQEPPQRRG